MKNYITIAGLFLQIIFVVNIAYADEGIFNNLRADGETEYLIRLKNGDEISGTITEHISDPDDGEGIKFRTEIGTAVIYESQVLEIIPIGEYYRHKHRIFLQPTADPISNDHFIGAFELMLFYMGFGISDYVSVTAGHSFIPSLPSRDQVSLIDIKATLVNMKLRSLGNELSLAVGGNLAFVNHNNRFTHLYGVGTFKFSKTSLNAMIFSKIGGKEIYDLMFGENYRDSFLYSSGSTGLGLGVDTKFSSTHNIHFIGELWNSDFTRPSNTAILLGFRIANTSVAADFGLAFFTQPFIVPFGSFVWTPF